MREYSPIELSGSVTKSAACTFVMLDGRAGDNVQDVDTGCCIILKIRDLDANAVVQVWRVYRNVYRRIQLFA